MDQPAPIRLSISGMSCASCVSAVEQALRAVPGVREANVNLVERTALISGTASAEDLIAAVRKASYDAAELKGLEDEQDKEASELAYYRRRLSQAAVAALVGLPLFVAEPLGWLPMISDPGGQRFWLLVGIATLAVLIYSGGHFFRGAWQQLRVRSSNMDTLIALGTGAAWCYSMAVVVFPDSVPSLARHAYFEAAHLHSLLHQSRQRPGNARARPHFAGHQAPHRSATQNRARDPRWPGARYSDQRSRPR